MRADNKLIQWLQQVLDKMVAENGKKDEKKTILLSSEMENAVGVWTDMYNNEPPWMSAKKEIYTMGLPGSIASELSRLTTLEMVSEITGSGLADFMSTPYQEMLGHIRAYVEYGCAKGGLIFKPYPTGDGIAIDFVQADGFYPTSFDSSGRMTGVIFADQIRRSGKIFTKMEWHEVTGAGYQVINKAFVSSTEGALGHEIPVDSVEEWASLVERIILTGVEKPLFGFFRVPSANRVDNRSIMGPSVFSGAEMLIREADEQYSRIIREYRLTEPALFVNQMMLGVNRDGNIELPSGNGRLYRKMDIAAGVSEKPFFEEWAPDIRDSSLFNGLNRYLQRIEFECGLAYGTLSDMQQVDKTATEIRSSKQRSYSTVSELQKALEAALVDTVDAMAEYARLYNLSPAGNYEVSFNFDDSIVVDTEREQAIRMQEVNAGILSPVEYLKWRYGVTDEQAVEMMPKNAETGGTSAIDQVMANWAGAGAADTKEA